MWDSNAPLQLLQTMPRKLTAENLEKLQLVIDADKYKNSLVSGFDLCGMYAPFCRGCRKTSIFPCAIAYVNMIQAGGVDIEIDARPMAMAGVNPAVVQSVENTVREETPVVNTVNNTVKTEQPKAAPVAEPIEPQEKEQAKEQVNEVAAAVAESEEAEVTETAEPETVATNVIPTKPSEKRKIRIAVARKKM